MTIEHNVLGDQTRFRSKVLWLIELRWIVFFLGVLLLFFYFSYAKKIIEIVIGPIAITIIFLGIINFIFYLLYYFFQKPFFTTYVSKRSSLFLKTIISRRYAILCFMQVLLDYACVTYLIISYGFTSLNLGIVYLPHIIITSVIFERRAGGLISSSLAIVLTTFLYFYFEGEISPSHPGYILLFNIVIFCFVYYLVVLLTRAIVKSKRELQQMNTQLVAIDKEKQSYTLRATHELKAPFAAIQSYIHVILAGHVGEINPQIRQILGKIDIRCDSLSKMIKHIIQLSNLKTSVFEKKEFHSVNLLSFLEEKINLFKDRAQVKNIDIILTNNISPNYNIDAIPNLFEILFDNLISNAIQYSHSDSKVEVMVQSVGKNDDEVVISVKDHGIGIPQKHLENIFREHFRCNNAASHSSNGNGMGLAIVKEICRLHHGFITVESELNKGAKFSIRMPTKIKDDYQSFKSMENSVTETRI